MQLLPTLNLFSLMIWYSGVTALFLFLLARAAPAFWPSCKLFGGLQSTNKPAVSLLLLSDSCSFLRLSFYFKLCGRSSRNCLLSLPVLSGCNGIPKHLFLLGNDAVVGLARQEALLALSTIPCSLSSLISCFC